MALRQAQGKQKISKKIVFVIAGGALLLVGFLLGQAGQGPTLSPTIEPSPSPPAPPAPVEEETFKVTKVIDGDTIKIETGESVRYIGIDAAEEGCFADEATAKNKELVEGKEVRLEKDVSETDKYGRLLRYVYVDNLFVNDYLVRNGYAQVATYPPDVKYQDQFREAEREAKENNKGLWAEGACVTPTPEVKSVSSPQSGGCKYSCSSPDRDCSDFTTQAEAQAFFDCCGFTATYDPMRLDAVGVGDGIPCESLP